MRTWLLIAFMACLIVSNTQAAAVGPYPVDAQTLHLWHFDALSGAIVPDMATVDPLHLPLVNGATLTSSVDGYGNALNTYDGKTGVAPYAGDAVNAIALSRLTGANGAFTFEAIVRPDMAPGAEPTHMEIICAESDGANEVRGFQFRIQDGGTALRFQSLAGSVLAFDAPITYTAGQWYHVAVTYDGNANTPGNLKLYWTALGTATSAQQVGSTTFNLTADLTGTVMSRFAIGNELRTTGGIGTENFEGLIDEVRISKIARTPGDMMLRSSTPWARNPVPVNGQKLVDPAVTTKVAWNTAELAGVTGHYLYLVEGEPNMAVNPTVITDLTEPIEASISGLKTDKVYYWRVDESINNSAPADANTVTGPVWFFETVKSVPAITANPRNVSLNASETAVFSAKFDSLTTPTASWYKVGTPDVLLGSQTGTGTKTSGDFTVAVTSLGGGSFAATLSVANVEISDEAYYYCSVTNGSSETKTTLSAGLTVKRLVAHYPFDGNANDAAGTVHGTLRGEPNDISLPGFITGVPNLGQAIEFDGTQYVQLTTEAYPKSGLGAGLEAGTIACWVRVNTFNTATAMILGTHNDGTGPGCQMWLAGTNGQQINFRLRQNAGDADMPYVSGTAAAPLAGDGQWHLIAATYEKGSVGQLYLDGLPFGATDTYTSSPAFEPWDYPMIIGANNNRGVVTDFLDGAIDDVKVFNYRLTGLEIADMYLVGKPDASLCLKPYENAFDYDGNCRVDLADFATFASHWLSCGRYPESTCGE
jgi:hypothetical protein